MIQQGQVFKLKTKRPDGQPLWAYRLDVERQLGVVYVRRAYANGRIKHTKTRLSTRPPRMFENRIGLPTFALRAGVPVFAVSRFMGASIAMIDRHCGHLANDSREHAVALLDALAFERAVDAA